MIKKEDALLITNHLMGNEGGAPEEAEEYYISAISEVMNQMVGSSSTALANILHVGINISPPITKELTKEDRDTQQMYLHNEMSIRISFRMEIQDLLVSNIMQIMPCEFGKKLAHSLINDEDDSEKSEADPQPVKTQTPLEETQQSIENKDTGKNS